MLTCGSIRVTFLQLAENLSDARRGPPGAQLPFSSSGNRAVLQRVRFAVQQVCFHSRENAGVVGGAGPARYGCSAMSSAQQVADIGHGRIVYRNARAPRSASLPRERPRRRSAYGRRRCRTRPARLFPPARRRSTSGTCPDTRLSACARRAPCSEQMRSMGRCSTLRSMACTCEPYFPTMLA